MAEELRENLFTLSAIKLFGREFKGLSVNRPFASTASAEGTEDDKAGAASAARKKVKAGTEDLVEEPPLGARARVPSDPVQKTLERVQGYRQNPGRLERALRKVSYHKDDEDAHDTHARFARIYGFTYEGQYYELPRPTLFLVYGPGITAEDDPASFTAQNVGVAAKDWKFASDIMMWQADDKDVSMCIDIESGPMKEILLHPIFELEEEIALTGAAASRGAVAGRGAAASRGAAAGRGAAVARGAAITRDPHRNR
jgi:hypothetical protein